MKWKKMHKKLQLNQGSSVEYIHASALENDQTLKGNETIYQYINTTRLLNSPKFNIKTNNKAYIGNKNPITNWKQKDNSIP